MLILQSYGFYKEEKFMATSYRNIKKEAIDFRFNIRNVNFSAAKTVLSKKANDCLLPGNGKTVHTVLFQ